MADLPCGHAFWVNECHWCFEDMAKHRGDDNLRARAEAAEKALAEYQRTASYEFHGQRPRCSSCETEVRSLCRACSGVAQLTQERDDLVATVAVLVEALKHSICERCKRATAEHHEHDCKASWHAGIASLPESARKHAERVAALEKVAKAARILSNLMPPDSCDGIDEVQAYEILVEHLGALDKLEGR